MPLSLLTPKQWAAQMAFSNRYERDIVKLRDGDVPSELVNALNALESEMTNIVLGGGLTDEWGDSTPENLKARRAVADILARFAAEFALAFDFEEEGGEAKSE